MTAIAIGSRRITKQYGDGVSPSELWLPVTPTKIVKAGGLVCIVASTGTVEPARVGTGLIAIGRSEDTYDNSATLTPQPIAKVVPGIFSWNNSAGLDAIGNGNIGQPCYMVDDQTVALTDGSSTRSVAGMIVGMDGTQVIVSTSPAIPDVSSVPAVAPSAGSIYAANVAAAEAVVFTSNAASVYVATLKDEFYLDINSSLTVDHITVLSTPAAGTTRLIRKNIAHPFWRAQVNWFVDSVAGNDEANGLLVGTPIKTLAELSRRWGLRSVIKVAGNLCTITIAGNPGVADPLTTNVVCGPDMNIVFAGTPVVARSGTIDTFTAIVPTVGSESIAKITDLALPTWASDKNKRFKITASGTGSRVGAIAWSTGLASAGVGGCNNFTKPVNFSQTTVTPGNGDTYDVETLPRVCVGAFDCQASGNSTSFAFNVITFKNLDLGDDTTFIPMQPRFSPGVVANYLGCRVRVPLNQALGDYYALNCDFNYGVNVKGCLARVLGCLFQGGSSFSSSIVQDGAQAIFDQESIWVGGGGLLCYGNGAIVIGSAGFFNTVTSVGGLNSLGDAISLGKSNQNFDKPAGGGLLSVCPPIGGSVSRIYGTGNAGAGIRLNAASRMTVDASTLLSVTGTGGDFRCGTGTTLGILSVDPATNATTLSIDQTWANYVAARPTGFGKTVLNPANGASMVVQP